MTRSPVGESLRPLREDPSVTDPDLALGASLLHTVGPAPRAEPRKRRVWHALNSGRPSATGVRVRALHLAFAALLVAAASSATLGYYVSRERAPSVAPPPVPAAPLELAPRPQAAPAKALPVP